MIDDKNAIQTLHTIAHARLRPQSYNLPSDAEACAALLTALDDVSPVPATEGELARAALEFLALDPAYAEPIRVMTSQPGGLSAQKYFDLATITTSAAVLLVLMTRFKAKRNQKGEWSIEIDKPAAKDALLKPLIEKLLSHLGK
jgi:hypothetical protein